MAGRPYVFFGSRIWRRFAQDANAFASTQSSTTRLLLTHGMVGCFVLRAHLSSVSALSTSSSATMLLKSGRDRDDVTLQVPVLA